MTDAQASGKWRHVYDRQGHITETHDPLGRWHRHSGTRWHQPETEVGRGGEQLVPWSTMNAAIFLR